MSRKIKVAYLIDTLEQAGAEKQLVTVATGLNRSRFEPSVICLTRMGFYEKDLREAGIPVFLIGKRHKLGIHAYRRLRALLREIAPDILHTWMFTCNLYGRLAARGSSVKTLASEVSADPTKSSVRLAVDRILAASTSAFYMNSRKVAQFYHERCGIPFEKITVIPNGVEPRVAEPVDLASLSVPNDSYVICCAGRLSQEKGFDRMIRAIALDGMRHRKIFLLIVGEGPLKDFLQSLAERLGVADRVRFLGHRQDLLRIIRAADVFVLPSLYEGMSNVLMEAMVQGKPCIATAVGGVDELIVNGESGIVIPRSDPELIAEAVSYLMESPEESARLGRAGQERMARHFSVQENVRRFEELYLSLVEPSKGSNTGKP